MSDKVSDVRETGPPRDKEDIRKIPFFFIFLCSLCVGSIYSNIAAYHITVNMVHSYGNGSASDFYGVYDYREIDHERVNITILRHKYLSNPQKESLIMVAPIGGLLSLFPVAFLYNQQGFRRSLVICVLLSVVTSMFIPLVTSATTFVLAVFLRIVQGFSLAAFIPYVCKLSVFLPFDHISIPSIVFSIFQLAAIVLFPIAGLLCWSPLGWHAAHYLPAVMSFLLLLVFLIIHFDDEFKERAHHHGICSALCTFERSRSQPLNFRLPYLSIYQDVNIWAFFFAAFGYFTAVHQYLQYGPTFLHKIVGLNMIPTGLLSTIPPLANLCLSFFTYYLFQRLLNTVKTKMRVFNTLGTVIPGGLFMLMGLFDPDTQQASITAIYVIACSLLGSTSCGFFRAMQLRSGKYHLFLLLNLFVVELISAFLTSLFNVLIAKEDEYSLWTAVFELQGAIMIVSNIVFCIFVDDQPAPWAKDGYEDSSIRPNRDDPLPQFPL